MKNNWKEEFDNLMDNYLKHFADAVISKHVVKSVNKEQDDILYNFIESLLAEQKKELMEEALAREKLLVDMHRVELDAISCMSLERFIKWSDDRKNKESLNHHE